MGKKVISVVLSNMFDAMTIVLMVLAGRFLGETDFGLLSYALSLSLVVLGIGNSGLAGLTTRDVARDRSEAPRYFALILPWAMTLTLVAWLAMIGALSLLRPQGDPLLQVALLIGAATYFRAMVILMRAFFKGLQRFDKEALAVGLENLLVVVGGTIVLLLGHGLIVFSLWLLVGRLLGFLINALLLRTEFPLRLRFDAREFWPIARAAIPIDLAQFVFMLITHVDMLLLGVFVSFAELGQFSAAFRIYWGLMLAPTMISTLFIPALAERLDRTKEDYNAYLLLGGGATLFFGLGAIVAGVPLAGWGITLLYGTGYAEAVPVMRLLLFACLPAFTTIFLRGYLVVIDRRRPLLAFGGLSLATRLAFLLLLVPGQGILGAARAILLSETVIATALVLYLLLTHFALRGLGDFAYKLRAAAAKFGGPE